MRFGRECVGLLDNESSRSTMSESRELRLPHDLCAAAEKKFAARFQNIEELLTFLLQELVRADTQDLDRADQAVVEQRLRDLGYM